MFGKKSGYYWIFSNYDAIEGYCDMTSHGGKGLFYLKFIRLSLVMKYFLKSSNKNSEKKLTFAILVLLTHFPFMRSRTFSNLSTRIIQCDTEKLVIWPHTC